MTPEEVEPPDAVLVNHRWIARDTVDYAEEANEIMMAHGSVRGTTLYSARHQARWRAQRLIKLMCDLGLHERWQLREHTDPQNGGWIWTVEYLARR